MASSVPALKNAARALTINALAQFLNDNAAVQFADNSWAVLQEVEGQEIWTEVTVKSKSFSETARGGVFDPFEVAEVWKEENAVKEKEKAEKAKAKAAKIAADKAKREAKAAKAAKAQAEDEDDPNQHLPREAEI